MLLVCNFRLAFVCVCAATVCLFGAPLAAAQQPALANRIDQMREINPQMPAPLNVDVERVRAAGIKVYEGESVTIYTDVDDDVAAQDWVDLFDAAIDPWCDTLKIRPASTDGYRLAGMVMQDIERFKKCGLVPPDLPGFPAGYSRGHEFWLFAQKDEYYTQHLLLHEGTHAFMNWFHGSTGPPWFSEGMAEWVALHQWNGRRVKLAVDMASADDCRGWGRIGTIKRMIDGQKAMSLDDVFNIPPSAFRDVRYYAWSWAACEFLSSHPLTAALFEELPKTANVPYPDFNAQLQRKLQPHRAVLDRDWGLFINELDYGYNVQATVLNQAQPTATGKADEQVFKIAANHSWQSTGIKVAPGDRLKIAATGQFIIGETSKPWICEADGITIEYYSGQPLGKLMGCLIPQTLTQEQIADVQAWRTFAIGRLSEAAEMPVAGTLCLRVNESPGDLSDNSGHLEVSILKVK